MPYGLCGAAQSFQRYIDKFLGGLKKKNSDGTKSEVTYFAYIYDILIASENEDQHETRFVSLASKIQ